MSTAAPLPADKFDQSMTFVRPDNPPIRVPLDKLAVLPGFNTRVKDAEYDARVEGIKRSIHRQGFYEDKPFSVTMIPNDDTVYIFDGEHRFDAARAASLDGAEFPDGLPVAWAKDGATVRDLTIHLVHGNAGANLNPVEMAAVVSRLLEIGLTKEEVAEEIDRTVRHVENLIVLGKANASTKRAVAAGQIAAAEVTKKLRKQTPAEVDKFVSEAVKKAADRGAKKATPRTMATGPKMKVVKVETSLGAGETMGDVLKAVAKQIRDVIPTDDSDKLTEDGRIVVNLHVIDHEAEAAKVAREKERAEAAEKRAAEKAEREATKAAEKKEREAKKAAAQKATAKAAKKATGGKAKGSTAKTAASKPKGSGKAASGGKAAKSPAKAPQGDSKAEPASGAPKAADGAPTQPAGSEDPNKGL